MQRIDYQIALNHITEASETPHQAKQWFMVQQQHAGEIARVRLALHSLPYVTSYELPFRLLLIQCATGYRKTARRADHSQPPGGNQRQQTRGAIQP
ncbi:hypothetical protein SODG_005116 [Sodalis praecaptivus]